MALSFKSTVGTANFETVQISADLIAEIANQYLPIGTKKFKINRSEITMVYCGEDKPNLYTTVNEAIAGGTQLFDALAYFSLKTTERPEIMSLDNLSHPRTNNPNKVADALAYLYFFLMTRANVPEHTSKKRGSDVPKFLFDYLGMQGPPKEYMETLASFSLNKVDHTWIKKINLTNLGNQFLSRLALGVAGYRVLAPFAFIEPEIKTDKIALKAADILTKFVREQYVWDCHPVTKNPGFVKVTGSLNDNATHLLAILYKPETLEKLKSQGALFEVPASKLKLLNYPSWTETTFAPFTDKIFPDKIWGSIIGGAGELYLEMLKGKGKDEGTLS